MSVGSEVRPVPARPRRAAGRLQREERRAAAWFLAPAVLLFLVFTALPVLASFGISFMNWDLFTTPSFAGLENFARVLRDPIFHKVLLNTVLFVLGTVGVQMAVALGLALLLNTRVI